jgi:hypothetical protein
MSTQPFIASTLSEGETILKKRFADLGYLFIKNAVAAEHWPSVLDDS